MSRLVEGLWWAILLLVLLWAPIPLGSVNTEWSMPLAAICLLLGVWRSVLHPVLGGSSVRLPSILMPLGILVLFAGVQLVPLPRFLVGLLSPARAALPAIPGEPSGSLPLSVYPGATLEQGLLLLGLVYLIWGVSRSPGRKPFYLLMIVGLVHGALGFFLLESGGTDSSRVLWVYELPEVLTPFGTFVNKNHFAGLMVICSGGVLAILFRRWTQSMRRLAGAGAWSRLAFLTGRGFLRFWIPLVVFLLLLAAFASGSRGGAAALLLALILVPVVSGIVRREFKAWPVVAGLILCVGAGVVATAVAPESVLARLVPGGRYLNRPRLWRTSLEMTLDYPVTGSGLGTFALAYPPYQSFAPDREFTHAESDWVQYLAETGLIGAGALAAFGVLLMLAVGRALRTRSSRRGLLVGGSVGFLGIVLHGMVDVSLHIPANLVAAGVLVGGLVGNLRDEEEEVVR